MSAVDVEETLWNLVLEAEDCLLTMESRKEHSLWARDMDTFLGGCRRKYRQGTCSASVSLLYQVQENKRETLKWSIDCICIALLSKALYDIA